ncbi:MAG: 2,3-diaminopropionate biosynthesis protein SbnA [Chitinophagales bacterium]
MEKTGILSLIGNTPLLKLNKFFTPNRFNFYAKLEMYNAAGSIKDRPAFKMLSGAFERGEIDENTTIVESSSGNTGIGLSMICAYLGLQLICVVDGRCTTTNRRIIEAYGGKISMVEKPHPEKGFLGARWDRVNQLLKSIPNSFNCNQYQNLNNPLAHHETVKEIMEKLGKAPDFIFCATSTCGTLRGISEFIKTKGLPTKVIAVDAVGSVLFGDTPKKRLIPGHGSAAPMPLYYNGLENQHILVTDLDCIVGCRTLIKKEGVFAGGSSGAVISGITKLQNIIPDGADVVAIVCDRGGRYLDTVYSNEWVAKHFGNVAHLWKTQSKKTLEEVEI